MVFYIPYYKILPSLLIQVPMNGVSMMLVNVSYVVQCINIHTYLPSMVFLNITYYTTLPPVITHVLIQCFSMVFADINYLILLASRLIQVQI
jgi:hypothetical protein